MRLIDADFLKEDLTRFYDGEVTARQLIDKQPTVELEQKHNRPHWVISSDGYYPYCSECKSEPKSGEMTDFCPNCGADMREKVKINFYIKENKNE